MSGALWDMIAVLHEYSRVTMDAIAEVEPRDASPVAPATAGRGLSTALVAVQHWVRCNLPVEQSALAYDLILLVIDRTLTDSPLTLKELFHSLPYSETGVRKQLTRLIKTGQMRIEVFRQDGRVRHVVAEPCLIKLFEGLNVVLRSKLGPLLG